MCVCEKRFPILHFPLPLSKDAASVSRCVGAASLCLSSRSCSLSLMQCFLLMHILHCQTHTHTHMHMHLPHVSLTCLLTSNAGQQQFLFDCISRATVSLYGRAGIIYGLHTTLLISTHTHAYMCIFYVQLLWE